MLVSHFRTRRLPWSAIAGFALCLPVAGCSMFGGKPETSAAQSQRVADQVNQAVTPLRKEVDELRDQTVDNTREIGVLKTEVEVIKRDTSRRPVITTPNEETRRTPDGTGGGNGATETAVAPTGTPDSAEAQAEAVRAAKQRALDERIAREKAEAERLVQERSETDRQRKEREQAEADRLEREKAEADRQAREQAEADRVAREKAEADRREREAAESERSSRDKAEADRKARELAEADRLATEKAEAERKAREAAASKGGAETTATKSAPAGAGVSIPADSSPEERAALLINALRTTKSDVESVGRQMRDVSAIVAPPLIKMLTDTEIAAKFRAEKALCFLDPKVAVPLLLDQLKKPQAQLATVKILGNLGDPSAITPLSGFLSDANRDLRFYSADSLVKLKDKRAIPYLIDYMKGSDTAKGAIAYDTLRQKTGQTLPYAFYGSPEERAKCAADWENWWKESGDRFEFK